MKTIIVVLLWSLSSLLPLGRVEASVSNDDMIRELEAQIIAIQARIDFLRTGSTTNLIVAKKEIDHVADHDWEYFSLKNEIRFGLTSEDVEILQEVFATDVSIYPERIATGYFGSLTTKAVKRFQKENGLVEDGLISNSTKEKINLLFSKKGLKVSVVKGVRNYCLPVDQKVLNSIKKNGKPSKVKVCPGFSGNTEAVSGVPIKSDVSGSGGENNNFLPEFYYLDAFEVTRSSAKIVFGVTEKVKATIGYAPSTGNIILNPIVEENKEWLKIHSFNLKNLLPGMTYNMYAVIVDGDGNHSTSSIKTFKTVASVDNSAPIISQVRISDLSPTTAFVSWKTNETSKKKIYYAPTNGFSLDKANLTRSEIYTVAHGLRLERLIAGTSYSFVIESEDVKGNKDRSVVWNFTTPIDDQRPPVFVSVVPVALSSVKAMVSVKSDEASRAMIHFGTSDPLDLGSSYYVIDSNLSSVHNFSLNDLAPSTNYRFVVSLRDNFGNISTSSVGSFRTK